MSLSPSEMALRYAAIGWHVIPVDGKRPVGTEWQKRASSDQAAVARLFATCQHDGVGVLIGERSGLIDFDCDSEEAEQTFQRLFEGFEIHTPSFQSSRGKHRLFRWTDRLPQGSIKLVVDGLEIRLGNGPKGCQTVFPPSGERRWIVDPDDCPVAEIPADIVERINARYAELNHPKAIMPQIGFSAGSPGSNGALDVPKWLAKHGREIIGRTDGTDGVTRWHIECPGIERHTTPNTFRDCCITQDPGGKLGGSCFHSSCGMRDWPSLRDAIGPLTWEDFPPIDVSGVDITGVLNEKNAAAIPVAAVSFQSEPLPKKNKSPKVNPISDDLFTVPGLISSMVDYNKTCAPRPRPALAFAASIALIGAIAGRKIKTKSGLRTNVYMIGLAPSGSGKDEPRLSNKLAVAAAGVPHFIGKDTATSGTALVKSLQTSPSLLVQIGEASKYFGSIRAAKNSPHLQEVIDRLLDLTGAARDPSWGPKAFATSGNDIIIPYPCLSVYGTSTGEGFWSSLSATDAADGFLARMLIVEDSDQYPRFVETEESPVPDDVVQVIKDWSVFNKPLVEVDPLEALPVAIDDAATQRLRKHRDDIEDRINSDPIEQRPIWSRVSVHANKLAMIFAASRGPGNLIITLDDAERSVAFVNWCTRTLISRVFTDVSFNEADANRKYVLRAIRQAGTITSSDLIKKTQKIAGKRARNEILDELIDAELVIRREEPTLGRPKVYYAINEA